MGQIGEPTEIIEIPIPAPAEPPFVLPDDWPALVPEEPNVPVPA